MEGTLEAELFEIMGGEGFGFNPSLHGRYSGSQLRGASYSDRRHVSIHLFMEGTLEGISSAVSSSPSMGFNPSLHGRYSGRSYTARAAKAAIGFNPSLHGRYSGRQLLFQLM